MKKSRSVEDKMEEWRCSGEMEVIKAGSSSESWVGGDVLSRIWSGDGGRVGWRGLGGGRMVESKKY